MSTLEIRDLHVSVETKEGAKQILRGVDLTVRSGETHAIMGPNGSGKSTLAYSLAGHLDRVLHGQEHAGAGARVHRHREHVCTVEGDRTGGDLVLRVPGEGVREGGLAGAVRAHDRVRLAAADGQVDAAQDLLGTLLGLDADVQVADLQG